MARVSMLTLLVVALQCVMLSAGWTAQAAEFEPSFWEFTVKDIEGKDISLSTFQDSKAILLVNVASACGYTESNYKELQVLYEKYHADGLEILAFPCNQFGGQEPEGETQILKFVQEKYQVTFPVLAKIEVNGPNAHPLFQYLKAKLHGLITNDIKWNFTKFLVVNGAPKKRYGTSTLPSQIEEDIVAALGIESSRYSEL
ncbi:hypothetical protein Poli38472_001325 [Pythium oligandrum]|uniref:Glutathione peroxidase n=1 Tax=Pythium oligandrum TaxID=41045 RepID=A0A8K1CTW6_PYTOL|nr:hypothetical protein Poli38472_001325 [Pythium oligandrum]|eukprot:TMW69169.1 hypothetical protein Poli38472_001325 [Pythium oligandrum]